MSFRKFLIIAIVACLFVAPVTYGETSDNFKIPDVFENVSEAQIDEYGVYNLKSDENITLCTNKYRADDYDLFFKNHSGENYHVSKLSNNMTLGRDSDLNDTHILEIVEHKGAKYMVFIEISKNATNDTVNDCVKYLEKFNELNNVNPVTP